MGVTTSPLQAIHQRELALRQQVEEAHCRAEAQLQAARQEAQNIIAQANREGRAEAEAIFEQGIYEAQQQASTILAKAYDEAATLRTQTEPRLAEVAARIVAFILPNENMAQF